MTNTATVTKAAADTELAGDLANNTDDEDTTVNAVADLDDHQDGQRDNGRGRDDD